MRRVLVIDPNRTFAKFAELAIKRMGYTCFSASNARDGLQILRGKLVSIILTEFILPDMSGLELCRKLKGSRRTAHIPIVVATVSMETCRALAGQVNMIADTVLKPVSVRTLYQVLHRHLDFEICRKNLRAPMVIHVALLDGTEYRSHLTLTVGEGGLFIETEMPRKPGTLLDITLYLPTVIGGIRIGGEVVYAVDRGQKNHAAGMGVKFVDVDPGTNHFLAKFMESYLSDTLPKETTLLRGIG